jgi:hypothetical protein
LYSYHSNYLDQDLNIWIDKGNIGNIAALLRAKLSGSGSVDFAGCNNASGNENIAKNASKLLNGIPVRGGIGPQLGYENHWLFGNSSGSFGLKKTYVDGLPQ